MNYFWRKHQNLAANLKIVKINSTSPQVTNIVQSSRNLANMIVRPSWTNGCNRFFKFITVRPWQPMKLDGEAAKQEVSPFLSNLLTYRNQTWNIDSWHHPGMAMCLMSCILSPWLSVQAAYLLGPRNAACSFNYYSAFFFCHWSLWQPIERRGKKLRNLAHRLRPGPWSLTANSGYLAQEL